MKSPRLSKTFWLLIGAVALCAGCATHIRKPASAPMPSRVKFSEFNAFVLKPIAIAPAFAKAGANQKAARKIDGKLFDEMKVAFPGIVRAAAEPPVAGARTLVIEPRVEQIKFIGGAARFWVGAMAGSSAVLMQVNFIDQQSGEVVANPEFYRGANSFSGGWSVGVTDNLMLDEIARDIVQYAAYNR